MQTDGGPGNTGSKSPRVSFVSILESDNLSECPVDQYHLIHINADLEYSRDHRGGSVVTFPQRLGYCPVCRTWYIDTIHLASLAAKGLDLRGIDIVGSATYPRPDSFIAWHPQVTEAAAKAAEAAAVVHHKKQAATPRSKPTEKNLAFRCLFCNGAQTGRTLGFRGVCTQDCYYSNITHDSNSWCANPGNRCREIPPDQAPTEAGFCMESRLLLDWQCVSSKSYLPANSHVGHFAVTTTVLPRESEVNRRVFSIFLIGAQTEKPGSTCYQADNQLRVELMADEPLHFWKFIYSRIKLDELDWGVSDSLQISQDAIIKLLDRATRIIKDQGRRAVAEKMLQLASAKVRPEHLQKLLS